MSYWFIGDGPSGLKLRLYADADFAGDRPEFKSTSGIYLALVGPNSFFPLAAKAQKQTAVAHSTVEAELISASLAVRIIDLPALDLWKAVLKRSVLLTLIEGNESTAAIIGSASDLWGIQGRIEEVAPSITIPLINEVEKRRKKLVAKK